MRPTSSSSAQTSVGGTRLRECLDQGSGSIRSGWLWLGLRKVQKPQSPWRFLWCVPRKSGGSSASFLSLFLLGFTHGRGPHPHGWCLCTFGGLLQANNWSLHSQTEWLSIAWFSAWIKLLRLLAFFRNPHFQEILTNLLVSYPYPSPHRRINRWNESTKTEFETKNLNFSEN